MVTIAQAAARQVAAQQLAARFAVFAPPGDPSIADDWDLRAGLPAGWTQIGSGNVFDQRGYYSAGAGGIQINGYSKSAALEGEGSLIVEVERAAMLYDGASRSSGTFLDMVGPTGTLGARCILSTRSASGDYNKERRLYLNSPNATTNELRWTDDLGGGDVTMARASHLLQDFLDPTYCTIVLTWAGTTEWVIVDGLPWRSRTVTARGSDHLNTINLGSLGASTYLGNTAIRRLQVLNRSLAPVVSTTRVGLLGDSFVVRGTNRTAGAWEPGAATTAAQLDGVQNATSLSSARGDAIAGTWGNSEWMWQVQAAAYLRRRSRKAFGVYNAGDAGNGWRSDLNPFGAGPRLALQAYDPHVILAFGSVNDVQLADAADSGMVSDIATALQTLAAGCTSLQRIIWFDPFFMPEAYATNNTAAHYAEVANQRTLLAGLAPNLVNAGSQKVAFERVATWGEWAPAGTVPLDYAIGSHPSNPWPTHLYTTKRGASTDGDVHPTAAGSRAIARIVQRRLLPWV
jgi:hypothetical protein